MYDAIADVQEENVAEGSYKDQVCSTEERVAYVLTKPLAHVKFEYFQDKLGVVWKDLYRKRECQADVRCSGE